MLSWAPSLSWAPTHCHPRSSSYQRAHPSAMNFFANFMQPQPSPADVYKPDVSFTSAGLPNSYDEMHSAAIAATQAAIADGVSAVEIDFPPIANVNARGDGSAKSERLVLEANVVFMKKLQVGLGGPSNCLLVGCSGSAVNALSGNAVILREAFSVAADYDVCLVCAPTSEEQWEMACKLGSQCVVVVNGLLQNGLLPHAYYYKALTAFSVQTGGIVRQYPASYECYDVSGSRLDLEIPLLVHGRRALPDTNAAQMRLQNEYGSRNSRS